MIGYKVLSKDGLKGPFKKSSILKAITSATLPLQARLLELHTGRYVVAAELVGEQIDPSIHTPAQPRQDTLKKLAEQTVPAPQPLKLDEESPGHTEDTPRVVLMLGKSPLKKARLPKPRKLMALATA